MHESVCDRNVRRTGNVNICRRSKDQRRAINNFDHASAVSGRGATIFAALAATFFRVPAFIFIGGRHILPL